MIDLDGTTLVVSGYPRSGTSMMMRCLQFAGFDLVISDRHQESVNPVDPHGILELDNLDQELASHPKDWTANRVIKIVAPYIAYLPLDRPVKVVFMLREIHDIVASLLVQRTIWEQDPWSTVEYARKYLQHFNVPTHFVHYRELMSYPKTTLGLVRDFIGVDFDIELALKGVEKAPRTVATFDKKIINASKEAFFEGPEDILVLNDPRLNVEKEG